MIHIVYLPNSSHGQPCKEVLIEKEHAKQIGCCLYCKDPCEGRIEKKEDSNIHLCPTAFALSHLFFHFKYLVGYLLDFFSVFLLAL